MPAGHLPLTGVDVPGSAGVPVGLQSGPDVQAPFDEPCVAVCAGDTGAPPLVELELDGAVCVTEVVAVAVPGFVTPDVVAVPVVADVVVVDDLLCLWVVVVDDELWLDPPQATTPKASTMTAAATMATRAKSPVHGVRCMT